MSANIALTLAEAGATWSDVVSLTTCHIGLRSQTAMLLKVATDYYHVATGNTNQTDDTVPGYAAGTGWDPVTGLGSPNSANLVPDLVQAAHGN